MIDQNDEIFFSPMIETIFEPKSKVLFAEPPANQEINVEWKKEKGFVFCNFWIVQTIQFIKGIHSKSFDTKLLMGLSLQGQNILFQCSRYSCGSDIMVVPSGRLSAATRRTAVPKSFPLFHVLDASRFKFELYTTAHSGTSFLPVPLSGCF